MFGKFREALSLDKWIENFEGYLDARIELAKYDAREAMVGILTKAIVYGVMAAFGLLALVCLNFAVGYWLGSLFGNSFAGFFLLFGFYFLLFLVSYRGKEDAKLLSNIEDRIRSAMKQPRIEEMPSGGESSSAPVPENTNT